MRLKNLLSFLDYMERSIVIVGYLYAIYYFYNIIAPLPSKVFGVVLFSLFFIAYMWQILKKLKPASEKREVNGAENNLKSESLPVLSDTVLKYTAVVSFLSFLFLVLTVAYEVLVQQSSHYFPLKLLACVLLYSIFKASVGRLVSLSQKSI